MLKAAGNRVFETDAITVPEAIAAVALDTLYLTSTDTVIQYAGIEFRTRLATAELPLGCTTDGCLTSRDADLQHAVVICTTELAISEAFETIPLLDTAIQ
jgi:hypothetical protein